MKRKNENTYYLGNESLPTRNTKIEGTAEDMLHYADEIQKCNKDLLYFAENYFFVNNPDEGLMKIKLHPYQKRFLRKIRDNRFVIFNTSRQSGKCCWVETPILTIDGWSTLGKLKVGDKIFDENGNICNVTHAFDPYYDHKCYKIIFDNGEEIIADEDHKWFTQDKNERKRQCKGSIKTTKELLTHITCGKRKEPFHRIKICKGILGANQDLPVDPYLLGYWIGKGDREGRFNIKNKNCEEFISIIKNIQGVTYNIDKNYVTISYNNINLKDILNNIIKNTQNIQIPNIYIYSSLQQRKQLLSGLMDSMGFISKKGYCEFSTKNIEFKQNIVYLLYSLGYKAYINKKHKNDTIIWRIRFMPTKDLCCLKYKKDRLRDISITSRTQYHYIKDIIPTDTVPVRCITVDSPSHMYVLGHQLIPTHNSTILTIFALWYVLNNSNKLVVLIANKEDTAIEIFSRIKTAYEELPNWFKSGVVKYDETKLILTNGSRITVSTTTGSAARGYTINVLMLDEFAFVECVNGDTTINVRNRNTKQIDEIKIKELYKKLETNNKTKIVTNYNYEILTPTGWAEFKSISKKHNCKCIKLIFNDGDYIISSKNHLFKDIDNKLIYAKDCKNKSFIDKFGKIKTCIDILKQNKQDLYDINFIDDSQHLYYTNNIISHNCNIAENFFKSVYPTISASKTSKIIITSTPNGDSGIFYRLCKGAENGENGWVYDSVIWSDIPGRTMKWKEETMKTLGSDSDFAQEFEAVFLSSKNGFLSEEIFQNLKNNMNNPLYVYEDGSYTIWEEPNPNHIYVAGVDSSEGVGQDASVINIFDITDLQDIRQVACYHNNNIQLYEFTSKCYEILSYWGLPLLMIERNNTGTGVIDNLINQYHYENIIDYGSGATPRKYIQRGIVSHNVIKTRAINNMRYLLTDAQVVTINDPILLEEFRNFVRFPNGTWAARKGSGYHDDRVMSMAWALFIIYKDLITIYAKVDKTDRYGIANRISKQYGINYFTPKNDVNYNNADLPVDIIGFGNNVYDTSNNIDMTWLQNF